MYSSTDSDSSACANNVSRGFSPSRLKRNEQSNSLPSIASPSRCQIEDLKHSIFLRKAMTTEFDTLVEQSRNMKMYIDTKNSFEPQDFELPAEEIHNGFNLSEYIMDLKMMKRKKMINFEKKQFQSSLHALDKFSTLSASSFSRRSTGFREYSSTLKSRRAVQEGKEELKALKRLIGKDETPKFISDESSTLDHPALDSIEENLEDVRQEQIEKWCQKHGTKMSQPFTNKEKRSLRKWFKDMNVDGDQEISVDELQDPMISSGILKTRPQVARALANVDPNGTMGIDFEEFLLAMKGRKLADADKMTNLQNMGLHPFISRETLMTEERRKRLFENIISQSHERTDKFDQMLSRFSNKRLTRTQMNQMLHEIENVEDHLAQEIERCNQHVVAVAGIVAQKKEQYDEEERKRMLEIEKWHVSFMRRQQGSDADENSSPDNRAQSPSNSSASLALALLPPGQSTEGNAYSNFSPKKSKKGFINPKRASSKVR